MATSQPLIGAMVAVSVAAAGCGTAHTVTRPPHSLPPASSQQESSSSGVATPTPASPLPRSISTASSCTTSGQTVTCGGNNSPLTLHLGQRVTIMIPPAYPGTHFSPATITTGKSVRISEPIFGTDHTERFDVTAIQPGQTDLTASSPGLASAPSIHWSVNITVHP